MAILRTLYGFSCGGEGGQFLRFNEGVFDYADISIDRYIFILHRYVT